MIFIDLHLFSSMFFVTTTMDKFGIVIDLTDE
jgi:hypothetical protein